MAKKKATKKKAVKKEVGLKECVKDSENPKDHLDARMEKSPENYEGWVCFACGKKWRVKL